MVFFMRRIQGWVRGVSGQEVEEGISFSPVSRIEQVRDAACAGKREEVNSRDG